ncbi:MAG: flippase-like domain-containing protein [Candidatus Thermoplasmatota archaeon]|nr:flippase-like domain-containing protein [Candidatus Thermoplasmatota archaeon]
MRLTKLVPIIGAIILLFILSQLDLAQIKTIFLELPPFVALLSLFAFIPLLLIATIQWRILLARQKIPTSFRYCITNFFIGYFYGFITPGGFGGYTRTIYLSKKTGAPLAQCASNIITYNAIEYLALLSIGLIGALALGSIYPNLLIITVSLLFVIIILYLLFFRSPHAHQLIQKIGSSRFLLTIPSTLTQSLDTFHKDLPSLKDMIPPYGLSLSGWMLKYIILYGLAQYFNIQIPFIYFILIMAVADVIASIPISIYGIGTREAALITLFSVPRFTNGVLFSHEHIVSFSLYCFIILWLIPSSIGMIITLSESRKKGIYDLEDDTNCEYFERYMRRFTYLYRQLATTVKTYADAKINPVIIDLGVGPGLLSKEIKDILPQATVIGIDPIDNMLQRAKKNADIETRKGSSESIPLDDASVDIVVTRFSLTYWKNPQRSFKEIHRVLKPGGVLIIEALNKDLPAYRLLCITFHMILKRSRLNVARYHSDAYKTAYRLKEVKGFFEDTGFTVISTEYKKKDWRYVIVGEKNEPSK